MPILLQALWSIPVIIFEYFLAMFGRKFTVATATVLAFLATTTAFVICFKNILIAAASLIVWPAWLVGFIGWFLPSNTVGCLSLIFSARVCKFAYRAILTKVKLINEAA